MFEPALCVQYSILGNSSCTLCDLYSICMHAFVHVHVRSLINTSILKINQSTFTKAEEVGGYGPFEIHSPNFQWLLHPDSVALYSGQ